MAKKVKKSTRKPSAAFMKPMTPSPSLGEVVGTKPLPRTEVTSRKESTLSMMPEGLLESLAPREVIDLIGYLQSPSQVPLPTGR